MVGYVYIYNKYINYIKIYYKKILGNINILNLIEKILANERNFIFMDLASHDVSILNFLFKNIEIKKLSLFKIK